MKTPKQLYQEFLDSGQYEKNPNQIEIIEILDTIFCKLQGKLSLSWWHNLIKFLGWNKSKTITGLYLYGGVGAGKTWLMDIFYQCIPAHYRIRMHFHQFMQRIHSELKQLQGERNPLDAIAASFAQKTPIICFDEFFVIDITDAMILANLLQAFFKQGIVLILTSNVKPDDLYKNGISREHFLPAIDLLKKYCFVYELISNKDYRLKNFAENGSYFLPLNEQSQMMLKASFDKLASGDVYENVPLIVNGRAIPTVKYCQGLVWFNFLDLCNIPRSQTDYLELTLIFDVVILSNVPKILPNQHNLIVYLIYLIDVFYDANIKLIISAEVPIEEIYTSGRMKIQFQRTRSRLHEMQTQDYWHRKKLVSH